MALFCRDVDNGAGLIDRALAINPNLATGWQLRAWVSVMLGEHEMALEQFARAQLLSPIDPDTYASESGIGAANLFLGRYEEALKWTAKALVQQPDWMIAQRFLAAANALAGNIDEARRVMWRILQTDSVLRLSNFKTYASVRRPADIETMLEGLRLAGLPE